MQIVGHRDDEEQNDQRAAHSDDLLSFAWSPRRTPGRVRKIAAQQRDAGKRHAHPHEIERQFHA